MNATSGRIAAVATTVEPRRRVLEARIAHANGRLALADEVEREHAATIAELRAFADRLEAMTVPMVDDLRESATDELETAEAALRELA